MEFSEKLILLRRNLNMTQTQLAEALGVTRQSVYKWESGASYPEAMTLFAMRGLFGVSVDAMLDPAVTIAQPPASAPIVVEAPCEKNADDGETPENTGASVTEEKESTAESMPAQQEKKRGFGAFISRLFGGENKK